MLNENSVCYRHDKSKAAVACQRCEKPICASCMNQASVGFHCPDCSKSGAQKVYKGIGSTSNAAFTVTKVLVGLIVAAYVVAQLNIVVGNWSSNSLENDWLIFGPAIAEGQWWRVVTAGFVHSGLVHIGFNAYATWIFGNALEPSIGKVGTLLVFAGGLFGGSLAVVAFNFEAPTLGASGAVLGLAGGLAFMLWLKGVNVFNTSLGFILGLNIFLPLMVGGISFWGHAGGLLGGVLIAAVITVLPEMANSAKPNTPGKLNTWTIAAFVVCLAMFAGAIFIAEAGLGTTIG